ncbi:serine/threonine-protein phosphatase 6 regulatory subunit 3 isoform X2 [Eurytemora carolleeae]|uniref:serine/threonine-protein phosphatase 6 regulatory subunit 3 isoform X2 n=1 Tax=Eurytemora carolleeae TaxID=1294199 RepID=UPI000C77837C|nr:serine/threonine-protein phosphatase 6 regulatory subunit 3 isoform X2 [Eurytemora carolleeae]|eukprot:XP_023342870.1 serine/threonine-protein phosphatase 6 regulatory subunit 3-like isoform X2 [Eurytemora affinis]
MYWTFDSGKVSKIDTILENENVSLNEILEQEDIIQECKNQNKKLVDFLAKAEVIAQLLDLILMEPDEEIDEKIRYKLPNIASELITCDIQAINESLVGNTQLMDRMISFLDTKSTLNPLLSSFFSKAFGVLITRRSDQNWYSYQFTTVQVLTYIKTRPGFTGLLLRHVHTSAVMDLLLRLITCVEGKENREMILKWLNDEKLIEDIIQLFSSKQQPLNTTEAVGDNPHQIQENQEAPGQEPEVGVGQEVEGAGEGEGSGEGDGEDEPMSVETDEPLATINPTEEKTYEELMNEKDKHDNAGQLLVEIIRVSRDALLAPTDDNFLDNSLLHTAESKQTAELLLDVMLEAPLRESVIVNGISVLLVLLDVRKPAPQGQAHYPYTSDQDNMPNTAEFARQEQVMIQTVEAIIPRLPDLVSILSNPPTKPPVHTTAGILDPPLGPTRLAICKLMAAILGTQVSVLNPALAQTSFLSSTLNLFFKYSLNNFLHLQVLSCIRSILTWKARPPPTPLDTTAVNLDEPPLDDVLQTPKVTLDTTNPPEPCEANTADAVLDLPENPLLLQLFTDARLLELLVRAWNMEFTPNISYMGHVTQICNKIEEVRKGSEDLMENTYNRVLLNQLFEKLSPEEKGAWDEILSGKLAETNKRNEIPPTREDRRNLSSDDDSDFRDIHFPQDTALQQIQQMSENFVETFGYNDDDFNDAEDGVRGLGKMSPAVNFLMNTDDNTKKAIFESICEGRPTRGEVDSDEEDDEDIWAERTAELSFGGRNNADISKDEGKDENNSSEEEENVQMEVDVDRKYYYYY